MSGNMSIHHTYIFIDYFVLYFEMSGFQVLYIDDHDYIMMITTQVEYREFRKEYTGITPRQKKWFWHLHRRWKTDHWSYSPERCSYQIQLNDKIQTGSRYQER